MGAFILTNLRLALDGVAFAGLLFLVASGFTLIFGLMRIANLAHGSFYLVGGYVGYTLVVQFHVSFWLALIVGALSIGVLGVVVERVLLRFMRGQELAEVLATVGLSLILGDLALVVFGGTPENVPTPPALAHSVQFGSFTYPLDHLFVLGLSVVVAVGLWLFTTRTRYGAIIRAGVDDAEMVSGLGINIRAVFTGIFFLGAALAGLSGVAGGMILGLGPTYDGTILQFALVVVIIGGLGSLPGAVVGSLVVGLVDVFGKTYLPELAYFTVFAPMVIMLALRPRGLFGRA
jgi:branched-chain amino acid transport system permease protein